MASLQDVIVITPSATSLPINGTSIETEDSTVFTPQLGRDMYLTLSGVWTGEVQLLRSTDDGATWSPTTIAGGQLWGHYTANCDEVVATPTDGDATYKLQITVASGSVRWRLAQ